MAAPLERPKTPLSVIVVGSAIAVFLTLFVFKMIIGFALTVTKVAVVIAIIAAVVFAMNRASDGE